MRRFALVLLAGSATMAAPPAMAQDPVEFGRLSTDQKQLAEQVRRLERILLTLEERERAEGEDNRADLLAAARVKLLEGAQERPLASVLEEVASDLSDLRAGAALERQAELILFLEELLDFLLETERREQVEGLLEAAREREAQLRDLAQRQADLRAEAEAIEAREAQTGQVDEEARAALAEAQAALNDEIRAAAEADPSAAGAEGAERAAEEGERAESELRGDESEAGEAGESESAEGEPSEGESSEGESSEGESSEGESSEGESSEGESSEGQPNEGESSEGQPNEGEASESETSEPTPGENPESGEPSESGEAPPPGEQPEAGEPQAGDPQQGQRPPQENQDSQTPPQQGSRTPPSGQTPPPSGSPQEQLDRAQDAQERAQEELERAADEVAAEAERLEDVDELEVLINVLEKAEELQARHERVLGELSETVASLDGASRVPRSARVDLRRWATEERAIAEEADALLFEIREAGAESFPFLLRGLIDDHGLLAKRIGPPRYRADTAAVELGVRIERDWTRLVDAIRIEAERLRDKIEQPEGGDPSMPQPGEGEQPPDEPSPLVSVAAEIQLLKQLQSDLVERMESLQRRRDLLAEAGIELDEDDLAELEAVVDRQKRLRSLFENILERLQPSEQTGEEI